MKILIINKFLHPNGGSETYIFEIGKQLQRMGHEVQYFGMEHEGRIVSNNVESYTSDMNFHAGGLSKLTYPFKILYSKEARQALRPVLEDFRPDVVHLNNINFQLTPSVIDEVKSFDKNIKIVYTAHDAQWVCPNHLMRIPSTGERCLRCIDGVYGNCTKHRCIHDSKLRSLLGQIEAQIYKKRHTYKQVDTIISPSQFLADVLSHNEDLKGRIVTLHNFVELPKAAISESSEVVNQSESDSTKRDYVLYFGRYDVEKGIRIILAAARNLPEVDFIFAGKGDFEKEIEELPNVQNVGFQDKEGITKLIRNARLSVFPSIWYENCPFSVIESIVNGTPVVGSNLGGVPELIDDGKTGLLFEAENVSELTDKIFKLWNDDDLVKKMHDNCILAAESGRFDTLDSYCVKLLEIYRE
ncbi:glycosyltransferase [Butyrivibrio fibrisolvens]|uniref:glycosyltransferase n=1 Tax=Butyrivibrio fibrisolvens TaxID=831 RepID=UPI00041CC26D|nr:glycosyltransferase [Butyrivibrio fibrisolvens]